MNASTIDRPFTTWKAWGALFLFWNVIALIFLAQQYMFALAAGRSLMTNDIVWNIAGWYPWILMTPLVFELARRFPLTRRRWASSIALHSVFAVMVMLLEITIFTGVHWIRILITSAGFDLGLYFRVTIIRTFLFDILFYFVLVIGYSFVRQLVLTRERETELGFIDTYLRIEKERFGDRLRISRRIAPEAREVMVPDMFLQPVVENAIRHAVDPFAGGGHIEITADIMADGDGREMVCVRVADDGPGIQGIPEVGDECTSIESLSVELGIGLQNTVERLGTLFRHGKVSFCRSGSGGLEVRMHIPLEDVRTY